MPSVVMDTSVPLLLAVGALAHRADHLRLELDAALPLLAELRIGKLLLG